MWCIIWKDKAKGVLSISTVNYTLRLDEADLQTAERVFSQLGLTLSAGFNIYVKVVVRQQKIPFELSLAPSQNEYRKAAYDFIADNHAIKNELSAEDFAEFESGKFRLKSDRKTLDR
jgi:DNA-damage-inducible protein J